MDYIGVRLVAEKSIGALSDILELTASFLLTVCDHTRNVPDNTN